MRVRACVRESECMRVCVSARVGVHSYAPRVQAERGSNEGGLGAEAGLSWSPEPKLARGRTTRRLGRLRRRARDEDGQVLDPRAEEGTVTSRRQAGRTRWSASAGALVCAWS